MKVLLAEDDLTTRKLLETVLVRWGYEVVSTDNGTDAWEILNEPDPPRIAILDRIMPGFDGLELCRMIRLHENLRTIYIIYLTTLSTKNDIVDGFDAGADDYITKPFHNSELKARVGAAQKIVQLQAELESRVLELEKALDHISKLHEVLPMCSFCHRIRDDDDNWQSLEKYIEVQLDTKFSHGLCPVCYAKHYPEDL